MSFSGVLLIEKLQSVWHALAINDCYKVATWNDHDWLYFIVKYEENKCGVEEI